MKNPQFVIRLRTLSDQATIIDELLATTELHYSLWDDADDNQAIFSFYATDESDAADTHKCLHLRIEEWSDLLPAPCNIDDPEALPRENWAESWKKHFVCKQLSPRIAVTPSWERDQAPDLPAVIEIDPGMAFGTGLHGTTRACLELLDALTPANLASESLPAIDMGCGTGILSIGAAKLGWNPVYAVDMDTEAVRATKENLGINGTDQIATATQGDLTTWEPPTRCPLVMVNILAPLLIENADRIVSWLAPGGDLVLSGILTEQFAAVCEAFEKRDLQLAQDCTIDKWTSGWFNASGNNSKQP